MKYIKYIISISTCYFNGIIFLTLFLYSSPKLVAQEYLEMIQNPTPGITFQDIQQSAETYFIDKDKGRGSGFKQWKRWEYYYKNRTGPNGELVNPFKIGFDEYHRYMRSRAGKRSSVTSGYWDELGPTNYTRVGSGHNGGLGRVNVIAFHPSNANTVFAGTPAGGLWKTTNNGASWQPLTDGIPSVGVSGIAIHPTNANIIYILTGDGDGSDTYSVGVLKTTNGGATWLSTGLVWDVDQLKKGYKLLMHPTNSDIIFAATSDGIKRTTDGGVSWTTVIAGTFNDIEFKPGDPTVMYAVSRTPGSTFFRSTNSGVSWTSSSTGTPASATRIEIGVTPNNSSYVYLLAGPATSLGVFKGVYRSLDSGLSFNLRANTPNILGYETTGFDSDDQAIYDLALAVKPTDVSDLVTGGINVWRSTDFGVTMSNLTQWNETSATQYTHADIHELVYNPLNNYLYCGSDGGIFYSTNDGTTWTDISSGLQIMQFYKIAITTADANDLLGGTQDNGTNYRTTNTFTFKHIEGADGYDCLIDRTNSSTLYGVANSSVFKSTNAGNSISTITPPTGIAFFPNLLQHTTSSNTIFVAATDVNRSTNGGTTWTNLGSNGSVDFQMGTNNTSRYYAASSSELQMSNNAGSTWSTISGNTGWSSSGNITGIAVDPAISNHVWICKSGYNEGIKVFYSSNAGTSWTNVSGSLPNVPVNCIIYEPGSNDGLYIGTDIGVFYRDNDLADWVPFYNGLPTVEVFDLSINTVTNQITAGTHGRGAWRSNTFSTCPSNYSLNDANLPGTGPQGTRYYQAADSIGSTRSIDGGIGTEIRYKAGQLIRLSPGFEVQRGSYFHGWIGPCGGGVPDFGPPDSSRKLFGIYEGPMPSIFKSTLN